MNLPPSTVIYLFTDIERSAKLAQEYPDAILNLLAQNHKILHQPIYANNGYVFQIE
jgi:hypothetical protein